MLSPRQHWSLSSHQDRDQSDWTWCKMVQIMYCALFLWVWPHVWWTLNVSLLSAKRATKEPQSRTHILGHKPANAGAQSHFRFGSALMMNKKCRAQLKDLPLVFCSWLWATSLLFYRVALAGLESSEPGQKQYSKKKSHQSRNLVDVSRTWACHYKLHEFLLYLSLGFWPPSLLEPPKWGVVPNRFLAPETTMEKATERGPN